MFATSALLFSCTKDDVLKQNATSSNSQENFVQKSVGSCLYCVDNDTVSYYLDGELVDPGTYDPYDSTLYVLVEGDSVNTSVHFNAFTDKEDYYSYGKNNGYGDKLYVMDLFAEEARTYADTSGAIAEYDSLGYVSEYHLDTIQSIYNKHIDMFDRAPLAIYKDFYGGSSMFLSSGWAAYLFGTWNNEVSRHYHLALYGIVHVYDKAFFRNRIGPTFGNWGWQYILFQKSYGLEYLNDKATSIIGF